jgi:hypothetical protein
MVTAVLARRFRFPAGGSWSGRTRRGVVALAGVTVLGLLATGTGFVRSPVQVLDPGAWLVRGRDLVHASAVSTVADWLLPDALSPGKARTAQDGPRMVVVDPDAGKVFTVDPVNLEITGITQVDASAVPFVRGETVYLVSDGAVRWLDPSTLALRKQVAIPGRADATLDSAGNLWVHTPRDGVIRKVHDGVIVQDIPTTTPGHAVDITLAADRPVVFDEASHTLQWLDPATGKPGSGVTLPSAATLQGDSPYGPRVWLAVAGLRGPNAEPGTDGLLGIDPTGQTLTVPIAHRPLLRPETTPDHVYAFAGDGTVTVVDANTGTAGPTTAMPAAREPDFTAFVKDGRLWYTAPGRRDSGNVNADGTVTTIQEDRASLIDSTRNAPKPNQVTPSTGPPPTTPAAPPSPQPPSGRPPATSPATAAPTTTPAGRPGIPAMPPGPGAPLTTAPPGRSQTTSTTTTTTRPPTTISPAVVPKLIGLAPADACRALEAANLRCKEQNTGAYGPDNHIGAQSAAEGTALAPGTEVTVSHGEIGIRVPDVTGRPKEAACALLAAAVVFRTGQSYGDTGGVPCTFSAGESPTPVAPGTVYQQSIPADTWIAPGQTVVLTYDSHPWDELVQCKDPTPNSWELKINVGGSCDNGWIRTVVGKVSTTPAPGTTPLHKWVAKRAAGTYNVSDLAGTSTANIPAAYYNYVGVIGHVLVDEPGSVPVYVYTHNSDRYFSLSDSDPAAAAYRQGGSIDLGPGWHTWP